MLLIVVDAVRCAFQRPVLRGIKVLRDRHRRYNSISGVNSNPPRVSVVSAHNERRSLISRVR